MIGFLAALSLSVAAQDPIPMALTLAEVEALEQCIGAARDPIDCGIRDDVAERVACVEALPALEPTNTEKWVDGWRACEDDLACRWWEPASGTDTVLLLRACSAREWGILKSVTAEWLARIDPYITPDQRSELANLERAMVDSLEAQGSAPLTLDAGSWGAFTGARVGAWGSYYQGLVISLQTVSKGR
jgi:hypothetical protein